MLRSNPSVLAQLSLKMNCGGTDSKTQSALRYLLKRRKLMRYHYISDSHVHSDCSFDGTDPVMMICERAAALGLYSIAVTDHCECDIYYKEGFDRSVVQSFF